MKSWRYQLEDFLLDLGDLGLHPATIDGGVLVSDMYGETGRIDGHIDRVIAHIPKVGTGLTVDVDVTCLINKMTEILICEALEKKYQMLGELEGA